MAPRIAGSDIWAFGGVLFELLTGTPRVVGAGPSTTEVLAAVLSTEPAWDELPQGTHVTVRRLLRRCLDKHPQSRLQAIGEARIALDGVLNGG